MKEVLKKFESLNIKPMIGFEFEFYILDRNGLPIEQSRFFYNINEILQRNNFNGSVVKEIELGQCEIISAPTFDLENLTNNWGKTLENLKIFFIKNNLKLNHSAKPFLYQSGNGMHINISLHEYASEINIFEQEFIKNNSDNSFEFTKSFLMNYSIAGILKGVQNNIYKYINNLSTLNRIIYFDRNSPINISWGKNNRTTLIRIPESALEYKRIEIRLPSSENNLLIMITEILNDIYFGIFNKLIPQVCTYGSAFDENYQLQFLTKLMYLQL